MASKVETWISVQPEVWKPEQEEDSIEGVLVLRSEHSGRYDSEAYYIENKSRTVVVFGTTVLEARMRLMKIGDVVKIVYKGIEKNSRNEDTKIFEVFKRRVDEKENAVMEEEGES